MIYCLCNCSIGWLFDSLFVWLVDWLVVLFIDWSACLAEWLRYWLFLLDRLVDYSIDCLFGPLDWSSYRLFDCLFDFLVDILFACKLDWFVYDGLSDRPIVCLCVWFVVYLFVWISGFICWLIGCLIACFSDMMFDVLFDWMNCLKALFNCYWLIVCLIATLIVYCFGCLAFWLIVCSFDEMIHCINDFSDLLIDCSVHWLIGCLFACLIYWLRR